MTDTERAREEHLPCGRDFATLLQLLSNPQAFPFPVATDEPITVMHTHASAVLLVKDRAYKLKKPNNFGFFDYSTPAQRRHFCIQEMLLNARLAPHIYLGIAPVLLLPNGQICFSTTLPPDAVPEPGDMCEEGEVIDYAVVMVRLPDEDTLESRVQAGTATASQLVKVAQTIATFHASVATNEHIASFGELEVIEKNWQENFEQMRPYVGSVLDSNLYNRLKAYISGFLDGYSPLFAHRVKDGYIRDCHGDLRLQHIYLQGKDEQLAIIDCIEFNERFRYSDVASELAFLIMELDAANRPDLSRTFVDAYVGITGDQEIYELLPFYACYRACVRGKVLSFQLDEPEIPSEQRERTRQQAQSLFALAGAYATGPTRPTLLLVGGLMGSGKSTLAKALQRQLGWKLFSSDTVRKQLAQLDPAQPQAVGFGQGVYDRVWNKRTYDALFAQAKATLAEGHSVILDASFSQRAYRQAAADIATAQEANVVFIECLCPREVSLKRLRRRWQARLEGSTGAGTLASLASDGRPDLYDEQSASWQSFDLDKEPDTMHFAVSTALPLSVSVEQVLNALGIARFVCWI